MRVLVTGANGQVGRELSRCIWPRDARVDFLSHLELDIADPRAIRQKIELPLDLVINAAAYTAVDRAEHEGELAHRTNAEGAGLLASRCAALGIPLIHLSTDYIFDGTRGSPYREQDNPLPLNIYGASKLAGEKAVCSALPAHIIIRTSSVFSQFGRNFVTTMLRLGSERPTLEIVADQLSCPTAAADIAAAILTVAERIMFSSIDGGWGTYHFCGQPPVTWFDFAEQIFRRARAFGMAAPELRPISATEYPGNAKRPAYSALDCSKIARIFGINPPCWAARLPDLIDAILNRRLPA